MSGICPCWCCSDYPLAKPAPVVDPKPVKIRMIDRPRSEQVKHTHIFDKENSSPRIPASKTVTLCGVSYIKESIYADWSTATHKELDRFSKQCGKPPCLECKAILDTRGENC